MTGAEMTPHEVKMAVALTLRDVVPAAADSPGFVFSIGLPQDVEMFVRGDSYGFLVDINTTALSWSGSSLVADWATWAATHRNFVDCWTEHRYGVVLSIESRTTHTHGVELGCRLHLDTPGQRTWRWDALPGHVGGRECAEHCWLCGWLRAMHHDPDVEAMLKSI